ncbi:MAG: leucyl/phenylalanyl-tRNA--protein transferase [Myxococcota bacterium]
MYLLSDELSFPAPESASPEGIVAIGGDVSRQRLLLAYRMGIFPWPVRDLPLLWFSPDPRFVLEPNSFHLSRSLRKTLKREQFHITFDQRFKDVIQACADTKRTNQQGTWITKDLISGYLQLHREGYAHSVEAWQDDELVGGLYGVSLGSAFFGESMFSKKQEASKVAFSVLVAHLKEWNFEIIDCQVKTDHLALFGAVEWSRKKFLNALNRCLDAKTRARPWIRELSLAHTLHILTT